MTTKNNPTETPNHKLIIMREFGVPSELVWKAWTEPGQVKAWLELGEDTMIESVKMDLRVGGKFRIQTKDSDGEYFTAAGTYLEVKAPERLVYTWDWEKDGSEKEFGELDGDESQLTVEFRTKGQGTQLVLTHEKFSSVKKRDRHEEGWKMWVGRLAKYIETKQS